MILSYDGRMGRRLFALTFLSGLGLLILAFLLPELLRRFAPSGPYAMLGGFYVGDVVIATKALLAWFPLWILSACLAKRLHDLGLTGWYQLILFVPFLIYLVPVLFFLPGKVSGNKYVASATSAPAPAKPKATFLKCWLTASFWIFAVIATLGFLLGSPTDGLTVGIMVAPLKGAFWGWIIWLITK